MKAIEVAVMLTAYDKMSQIVNGAVNKSNGYLHKMSHFGHETMELGEKMELGAEPSFQFFEKSVEIAEANEVAAKRLQRAFKNAGDKHGEAAEHAEHYSEVLAAQIGVEHQTIMAVQAKIATFRSVSGETGRMSGLFDRATRAAFDMAKGGFGEAEGNARQLGKALEDPIKGVTGLRRIGVMLNATQQEQIKLLVQHGEKAKAQAIIMKMVEGKFKGMAAATATQGEKMSVAMNQAKDAIGKALLPTVEKLMHAVTEYVPKIIAFIREHQTVIKVVAGVVATVLVVGKVLVFVGTVITTVTSIASAFGKVLTFLSANPIVLIIAAVVALAYGVYQLIKHWSQVTAWFRGLWEKIKEIFAGVVDWVKRWGLLFLGPVGFIIKYWSQIKNFFKDLWAGIKQQFFDFVDYVMSIPAKMYKAGANIVKSIWEGIKSMVMKPINAIKEMVGKIREYLPFSPAKVGPLRDIHKIRLVETIAESIKPNAMVRAMHKTVAATMVVATPAISTPLSANVSRGGGGGSSSSPITVHYSPVITITGTSGPSTTTEFSKLLKKHETEIYKVVEEVVRKKDRTSYK